MINYLDHHIYVSTTCLSVYCDGVLDGTTANSHQHQFVLGRLISSDTTFISTSYYKTSHYHICLVHDLAF